MQTFIRFSTGKTITVEFVDGVTTIADLKLYVCDKEGFPESQIEQYAIVNISTSHIFSDHHVLTRSEFGDRTFNLFSY